MPIHVCAVAQLFRRLAALLFLASTRTNVFPPYFRLKQVYVSKMVSKPVRLSEIG